MKVNLVIVFFSIWFLILLGGALYNTHNNDLTYEELSHNSLKLGPISAAGLDSRDFDSGTEVIDDCEIKWTRAGTQFRVIHTGCAGFYAAFVVEKLGYKVVGAIGNHSLQGGAWVVQTDVTTRKSYE